jgi:hypothetical protein
MRHGPRRCTRCQERWPQGKGDLCRRCQRELGDTRGNKDRERELVARHRGPIPKLFVPPPAPRSPRTVIIRGTAFEIVWDGTDR